MPSPGWHGARLLPGLPGLMACCIRRCVVLNARSPAERVTEQTNCSRWEPVRPCTSPSSLHLSFSVLHSPSHRSTYFVLAIFPKARSSKRRRRRRRRSTDLAVVNSGCFLIIVMTFQVKSPEGFLLIGHLRSDPIRSDRPFARYGNLYLWSTDSWSPAANLQFSLLISESTRSFPITWGSPSGPNN